MRNDVTRRYSELIQLKTFEERFEYLKIGGAVGRETFGHDRYLNQKFYTSSQWRSVRSFVIARDEACDLASYGHDIYSRIMIHHMNPIVAKDIINNDKAILDPDFLITTTHRTHNAIHYGDASLLPSVLVERRPGDTKLW